MSPSVWRRGGPEGLSTPELGVWHYVPFAPVPWSPTLFFRGRRVVSAAWRLSRPLLTAVLRRAGFDAPQLAYSDHFLHEGLLRAALPELTIFRRADNLAGFPGAGADFSAREAEFARRADLTICTTESSATHMASQGVRNTLIVPNGIQLDRFFGDAAVPVEYLGDDRPIIVYVGAAEHRLDVDLMVRGITELRQFRWVIIGPFGGALRERLHAAGAQLLGSRPHELLAGYLRHAHVGIVPFSFTQCRELIREVSPLKVFEYARRAGSPLWVRRVANIRLTFPRHLRSAVRPASSLKQSRSSLKDPSPNVRASNSSPRTHGRPALLRCSSGWRLTR